MSAVLEATIEKPQVISREIEELDTGAWPYRWTVKEFFRAIDKGVFKNPERLELLDGEVIERMAQGILHYFAVRAVASVVSQAFPAPCEVRQQGRWTLSNHDYVEPDVLFARGSYLDYASRDPEPDEVFLVVEVSDTTVRLDRGRKAAKYARIGVAEYWIVNLNTRQLEVHQNPVAMPESRWGWGYNTVTFHTEGEDVRPLRSSTYQITVADLLPAAELAADGKLADD